MSSVCHPLFELSPNQKLALSIYGVHANDIPDFCESRHEYVSLLSCARQSYSEFKKVRGQPPASGYDQRIIKTMLDEIIEFAWQSKLAWCQIQNRYGIKFPLQYMVHCHLYRQHDGLELDWTTIVKKSCQEISSQGQQGSVALTTRQDMITYYLHRYGYQYQKRGLFLPVDIGALKQSKQVWGPFQQTFLRHVMAAIKESLSHQTHASSFMEHWKAAARDITCRRPNTTILEFLKANLLPSTESSPRYIIYCIAGPNKDGINSRDTLEDQPLYIGQTMDLHRRMKQHMSARTMPKLMKQHWKKCSFASQSWETFFSVYILDFASNKYDADDLEQYYINKRLNGVNQSKLTSYNLLNSCPGQNKYFWSFHRMSK